MQLREHFYVVLGAIAYANVAFSRSPGTTVSAEKIEKRDLESIVSASGTIQPIRQVNVGAPTAGTVVELDVREGDVVKKGQFLMQIDPRNLQIQVDSQNASLAAARSQSHRARAPRVADGAARAGTRAREDESAEPGLRDAPRRGGQA